MKDSKYDSEFQEFASDVHSRAPRPIPQALLAQVRSDLNPGLATVFSKLLLIHAFTAVITLSICPQFGYRVFGEGDGLMLWFMSFGVYGCLVACGSFFMGTSLLIAAFALKQDEVRKIREHRVLGLAVLALLSLGFFVMVDAELILGLALAWFVGAWIGSFLTLELGWRVRVLQH